MENRGFRGKRIGTVALISGAHFVLMIVCGLVGMGDFGDRPAEPNSIERVAHGAAMVLMAPGRWLWISWASKNLHDVVEWGLVVANSLLWGTGFVVLWSTWHDRRRTGS